MNFPWVTLIFVFLFGLLPGCMIVWLFLKQASWQGDWLELTFVALTAGLAVIGTTATFLTEMGWFSIGLVLLFWVVLCSVLSVLVWQQGFRLSRPNKWSRSEVKSEWGEGVFLIIWLPIMLWLMLRPHQFVTGGADAGVYVSLGANIAQSGGILITDPQVAELDPILQNAFLRDVEKPPAESYLFPAFYVTDSNSGKIMPQFYPLHPVLQAAVFDVGGVQAELLLTGLWGVLGVLAVYLTTRQIADWRVAALALVGISLSALQVWFARYPTSETLTQFWFWASMWSGLVWLGGRQPARLWAWAAGLSMGMTFLTRIDMLFLLPILLLLIVWQWRRKQPAWKWFAFPALLLCVYATVHAMWQSRPYFLELYTYGIQSLLRGPTGLLLATIAGMLALGIFAYFYDGMMRLLAKYERPLRLLIIALILGLAVYGWFIRPEVYADRAYTDSYSTNTIPVLDGENLTRLGWYLSPLGIWMGIAGICLLIWRADWQKSILLITGIFFALFYLWRIRNNPVQIYAMRRYVPVVMPLFIIGAAYLVGWIANHKQQWAKGVAVVVACLWLAGIAWSARGFVSRVDYENVPEQIAQLREQLAPQAVVIFSDPKTIGQGDILGTPLKYLHGLEVFTLRNPDVLTTAVFDDTLAQWQADGYTVYWIEVADGHGWPSEQWELMEVGSYDIETTVLEARYDRKPVEVLEQVWSGNIMEVRASSHE